MGRQTRKSKPLLHNKCPPGFVKRSGFTRRNTGTKVKSRCVRSTRSSAGPIPNTTRRQKTRLAAILGTRKSCPPGQIARSAYVRRISRNVAARGYMKKTPSGGVTKVFPKMKSIFVPASCVKDTGKPGKLPEGAPSIGPLRKGELKQYGYSYKLPEIDRRVALKRAIGAYGPLGTYRKLNAVAKLTKLTSPLASARFADDRNWVRKTYSVQGELKAF